MTDVATSPFGFSDPQPRRRRRAWPWIVTLVIVVLLLGAAAFGAESLARGAVTGGIRTLIVSQLGLPADQEVGVEVAGVVIPQLISGTLDEVAVAADDVTFGELSGDVRVTITDMPIRADAAAGPGTAQVRLDEPQLRALLSTVDGFPADAVAIAAPEVTASTELNVFGTGIPIGIGLLPAASEGQLALAPARLTVAGAEVTADGLRQQFGGLADTVLRTWHVCVARHLPAALTLTSVSVEGAEVVAGFDIDGAVVVDRALRQNGTCG